MTAAVQEKVKIAQSVLTVYCPFFGHLVLKVTPVVTDKVPLAGVTRDRKLLINPEWAMSTTDAELAATIVHEVLHLAFKCWSRQGSRNAIACGPDGVPISLWNIAQDYTINEVIEKMAASNPALSHDRFLPPTKWEPKGLYNSKYDNWSDEEVYDDLLANLKPPPKGGSGKGQGSGGIGGQGQGVDGYMSELDGTKADVQEGTGAGEGKEGEGQGKAMSAADQKAEDAYWDMALVEAVQVHEQSKNKGSLPDRIKKMVGEITEPAVDWRDALAQWVGNNGRRGDLSYTRPSRRSEAAGVILPALVKWGIADVAILWDTSGSMNTRETDILSEVVGMCQDIGMTVWVITCDSEVHGSQKGVDTAEVISNLVVGGGGSDFRPAFELIANEQFEGIVIAFTDGYIDVPDMKPINVQEVLWVLWDGDRDPTGGRWGEVLKVSPDGKVKR